MKSRIAFVSASGNVAGAEVVLLGLIGEALSRGLSVRCISPAGKLQQALDSRVEHVEIDEQGLGSAPKSVAAPRFASRARRASRVIAEQTIDADAVIVNSFLALPAVRLASPRPPVSWIVHDVLHKRDWFAVLRMVQGVIDTTVAVSRATAAPLEARGLQVAVVANGVNWPVDPRPAAPVDPVIGCVALLTGWKGHESLLEAFAQVRTPGARLELAGTYFPNDERYAERLQLRAAAPDLAGRVSFLGQVKTLDVMRGWTLAVSPSIAPEATPLVVLEALSVGLPVIATALGGSVEILGRGAGWLVPPQAPTELAEAIDALIADTGEQQRLSSLGPLEIGSGYRRDVQLSRQLDALLRGAR